MMGSWAERAKAEGPGRDWLMDGIDNIIGRLSGLGEITSRPLFGGHGLYWRGTIFAILFGGKLYLKVDEVSKSDFVSRDMGPFRPNERPTLRSYYEVPPEVLADPEALLSWAREAIRAAMHPHGPAH
jgi:DNA transformation protein and related proteins